MSLAPVPGGEARPVVARRAAAAPWLAETVPAGALGVLHAKRARAVAGTTVVAQKAEAGRRACFIAGNSSSPAVGPRAAVPLSN
jgi:hypothetical protein